MHFPLKEDFFPRDFFPQDFFRSKIKDFVSENFLRELFWRLPAAGKHALYFNRKKFNNFNFSRLVNPSKEEKELYLHQEPVDVHIPAR